MSSSRVLADGPDGKPVSDRFGWTWPLYWTALGLATTLGALAIGAMRAFAAFDEGIVILFLYLPAALFLVAVLTVAWLIATTGLILDRRWRGFVSVVVSPAFGLVIPIAVYKSGFSSRFWIERPRMERIVRAMPDQAARRYKEFHWNSTGFAAGGNTEQDMVYDESDELPDRVSQGRSRWSADWTTVEPMGRHFYLVIEQLDQR